MHTTMLAVMLKGALYGRLGHVQGADDVVDATALKVRRMDITVHFTWSS